MTKKEILEHYNSFILRINDRLHKATSLLQKEKLSYSIEEIDQMGILYGQYITGNKVVGDWEDETFEVFVTYCGEAWMHYFGGQWEITLRKTDWNYRYPMIINWGPKGYPWISIAPLDWARLIEDGDEDPLSLPWRRNLHYFSVTSEWDFKHLNMKQDE